MSTIRRVGADDAQRIGALQLREHLVHRLKHVAALAVASTSSSCATTSVSVSDTKVQPLPDQLLLELGRSSR